jgi:hypothetical protein
VAVNALLHEQPCGVPVVRMRLRQPLPTAATKRSAPQPAAFAGEEVDAQQDGAQRTRRKKRKSIGTNFRTHADLEAALKHREVEELVAIMPESVAFELLGGATAARQVPSAADRLQLLQDAVALKAGSDGATLANARRAWEAYCAFADARALPDHGLPASAAVIASFLREEAKRAAEGKGSQGGTTVPNSRRVGLLWLQEKLKFPMDVDSIVVLGAANPGQQRAYRRADPASRQRKVSGSIPISAYCQFEVLANSSSSSPRRFFARSIIAFSFMQSVRAVDALRSIEDADELEPKSVMSGWSYFSKDGQPIRTFAPAQGFLGDLKWWPKHQQDVRSAGHVFPKWNQPWGSKGCVTKATNTAPLDAVMPKSHMVQSIKGCLMAAPLLMTEEQYVGLGITAHSAHGSPSDMLTTLGPHSHFGQFTREDVREMGHWLRLGKLEENFEGGTAGAQGRRRGSGAGRQSSGAFADTAAECAAAYCQGEGRHGRRTAQLKVRKRWIMAVRAAMQQFGRPWREIPSGYDSYEILAADPP